jgi:hypothetical protein
LGHENYRRVLEDRGPIFERELRHFDLRFDKQLRATRRALIR